MDLDLNIWQVIFVCVWPFVVIFIIAVIRSELEVVIHWVLSTLMIILPVLAVVMLT